MENIKIYQSGNFLIIEYPSGFLKALPLTGYAYEVPENDTVHFYNNERLDLPLTPAKISKLQDQQGNLIGNLSDMVAYLSAMGSSSQTTKIGFLDYGHDDPEIDLQADGWTDVPNDGAGGSTNKLYPPDGVTEVLDPNTGYLDFSQLSLGSQLLTRTHIKVTPTTNNALLQVRYLLGQGAGQYPLLFWSERLDSGSGQPYERVIPFPVYMGDLNTQGGEGKLQVKLSTSGTLDNVGSYIQILLR